MKDSNTRIDEQFVSSVLAGDLPAIDSLLTPESAGLSSAEVVDLFETQVMSRHLDLQSRLMQKKGQSFYTIGSAGHEGNAAYAKAFRHDDMAFLHYRSGAFVIQRSKQVSGQTPLYDMLLSFAASSEDPVSGGRHKVLGSKDLFIPPQTSTIASHLPKAMGAAYSVGLANKLDANPVMKDDAVIVCNFGDASANHSTAQGAINAAAWASYQSSPMPIVFICEDNGIGISTPTPNGWIKANFQHKPGLKYLSCNGLDVLDTHKTAQEAVSYARRTRKPVFLHFHTVRLLGHAGSDSEFVYRDAQAIAAIERKDPLLHTAGILIDNGILTPQQVVDVYQGVKAKVARIADYAGQRPRLEQAEHVLQSLVPQPQAPNLPEPANPIDRAELFKHEKHNLDKPQHLAKLINWALIDAMADNGNIVMCGEDIGRKGGVYNVTSRLIEKFGSPRVINTLLDEQSILGLAIGLAHNGLLPIPEIQFLAYVHNAEDQIRGEAATLSFFSRGQYTNPMVIRIAGLAYQKGFGGHFHNDNSFAVFRDIPGIIVANPSNGADAVEMLRECVRLAQEEQRVVVFLEPIALYMTKDLHETGDGLWTFPYVEPAKAKPIKLGELGQYGKGKELAIITYGNGYYLSRQAEKMLADAGIKTRVIDLRWLAPLNEKAMVEAVKDCKHILVVDECRKTGSISEAILAALVEHQQHISAPVSAISRLCAEDSFIPLGSASYTVLPSKESIYEAATALVKGDKAKSGKGAKEVENA
ncbi:dehydrogenase E1 component subunit alpha/beta [Alteromonas sp. a30]|uniref:dehydrogenase E1 component subunit alpha/beta n=1 Tax=Alteromonas sp. a30 TaxID=2730917 RepID=UPI0022827330|nr:alpha-ketoacid dehydrogenase subunit alpha/beta [Alteromonas sp. a30]MCY7297376.1 MFS transporter [Alteromonas sp. a30]